MHDRIPAPGKANRVKITMDDGTAIEGVLSYADDATQEGSAYIKANVLPDDVCAKLNIDPETSEPKDAFLAAAQRIIYENAYSEQAPLLGMEEDRPTATAEFNVGAIGEYVLALGGYLSGSDTSSYTGVAYNVNTLTQTAVTADRVGPCGNSAPVGDYIIFAGGGRYNSSGGSFAVAINEMLTTTNAPRLNDSGGRGVGAACNDSYAIFAGGFYGSQPRDCFTAYSETLTADYSLYFSAGQYIGGATAGDGEYALLAGYYKGGNSDYTRGDVYSYSTTLTQQKITSLPGNRCGSGGASINGYAIFAGGSSRSLSSPTNDVVAYSATLTQSGPANLSTARVPGKSTTNGGGCNTTNYAVISGTEDFAAEMYNSTLAKSQLPALPTPIAYAAVASSDDKVFFFARDNTTFPVIVGMWDAVNQYRLNLTIPMGWAYDFGGGATTVTEETQISLASPNPFNGVVYPSMITRTGAITGNL